MKFKDKILIFFFLSIIFLTEVNAKSLKLEQIDNNNLNYLYDFETFVSKEIINIVIEIPKGTKEKWEVSKINGKLEKDFFMGKPRVIQFDPYPVNYGTIPKTVLPRNIGGDGDPLDVILIGGQLIRGQVVEGKIIVLIKFLDFGEYDDKIVAVPLNAEFENINNIEDLINVKEKYNLKSIINWFTEYKGENIVTYYGYSNKEQAIKKVLLSNKYFNRYGIKKR